MVENPISQIVKKVARVVCLAICACRKDYHCNEHLASLHKARHGRRDNVYVHEG